MTIKSITLRGALASGRGATPPLPAVAALDQLLPE